ncbi:hypothetical protein MCOR34_011009 [Pyricularia oryzae]|uniref:Uncharacterized protein n=1 Tax=Pyricularia oryzae TaxID=318829 RepID=A0A4P7NCI0_PYROR|nr:hypothetical protein MCOR34_011009 [Pyricularia oryzae]KAI6449424.1 hypothetical protein MCOR17_010171 [Pyricularia oryzae]QBZ58284.1 hypothetical protein PoMZ_03229 [Pyricularia oryzae]
MKFSAAILISFLAAASTALPQRDGSPSTLDARAKKAAPKGFKCRINQGTGTCSGVDTCTVNRGIRNVNNQSREYWVMRSQRLARNHVICTTKIKPIILSALFLSLMCCKVAGGMGDVVATAWEETAHIDEEGVLQ